MWYYDLDGNPVKRDRENYPYSYDSHVIWKGEYRRDKSNEVYSDRLMQWDYEKYNECCKKVWGDKSQCFRSRGPKDIEKFLILYLGIEIKLTAIMEGCNHSTGYPIWVFIYEEIDTGSENSVN